MHMCIRTWRFLGASPTAFERTTVLREGMAGVILRRSSRLAATAAASGQEQEIALKRVRASSSFAKKPNVGKKKNGLKENDAMGDNSPEAGSSDSSSENWVCQELSAVAPLQQIKRERLLKSVPSRNLEAELWEMGFQHIAGVDEAGSGPLAGPVVAAACIIPSSITIEGINDSKKLSAVKREELYWKLTSTPGISFAVQVIDAGTIDEVNILQATMQAMVGCVEKLQNAAEGLSWPDYILVDGNRLPEGFSKEKARSVVKGDATCHVIAAASILAKVTRDRLMINYDKKWPLYGFKDHKGYGTAGHIAALLKHGPCDIHRRSFAPLKDRDIVSVSDL
ncbi:unnamed protein product [Calypogeia fissa]